MATATSGTSGLGLLFSNLEKFTGNADLVSWIKQFYRCCVVANKTDNAVKGQLLMLCVTGQAKAILENFEEDQNGAQGYDALKGELEKHYNTTAIKEEKMRAFEVRTQKVDESEEEFMYELHNLYKRANPAQSVAVQLTAVKRKFLQGIDPEIRRNIFVFCNDPYGAAITKDNLVEYSQKAKVYLTQSDPSYGSSSSDVKVKSEYENMISTMEKLNTRMETLEGSMAENVEQINAIADGPRGGYRGGFRGGYNRGNRGFRGRGRGGRYNNNNWSRGRGNRGGRGRGNNDGSGNNSNIPMCYKCGEPNHHSRFCLSGN